jgi:hypothetical protein
MTPGQYDFAMVRGTTSPFVFRLKQDDGTGNLVPLPYDDVRLSIGFTTTLVESIANGGLVETDAAEGEITWNPTPEETRQLPVNGAVKYEVEIRKNGGQEVYLMGSITGLGGLNDD